MPLVGVIEAGTVSRVVRSVQHAKGDVLILLEHDRSSGHLLFQKGELVMARLDELRGAQALAQLEQWAAGHYSLVKRSAKQEAAKGRVLLNGLPLTSRRPCERWLKREGWATSIVGHTRDAPQVIAYLQPDLVLMQCPRPDLGLSCGELARQLAQELHFAPMLVVVEEKGRQCRQADKHCTRISPSAEALQGVFNSPRRGTRLAVRLSAEEHTARVQRPATAEVASLSRPIPPAPADGITARDLWPMLMTLLVGSALIWTAWWLTAP